ncbi:glycine betaine ABC transporter substrate-binding protein [Tateyamaria sp. ANG-S1]|uniref:glycine betaine ABC transporter substrate-binding protein n=1 Tax=Tateyamaria sp. ANG-S1 TaxID=1577905 RepID=UPI00057E7E9C|nr:glycine betaine ABC transporter substrate-binding protein [Tateyamaria sp. ANG-S1]KIC48377.1 glycine/betaine ABC transporter substrate-binding protein [Tateyamaria sp. ANG-S1]
MKKLAFAATLMLGTSAASIAAADCGEVSITEMDWASAAVVTNVAKFLLEQGYGCSVTVVPTTTVPAMASVAETGEPDILTELWTSYTEVYEELRSEGKLVEMSKVLSDGGVEAWWIPDYLAEAHPELKTLEGIKANPQLVGGRFHDCPSGWGCDITNHNNFKASGLADAGVERFQHGSGETLATAIAAAYEAKEPWFGYYWAPTSVLGKYPMVQVEMPAYDADTHTCNGLEDCATPGLSAYPVSNVVTAATQAFVDREPEAAALMQNLTFTNAQMGEVLAWQEANEASNEEAAVYFLTTYKDVWGSWLNDDAKGKLSALLQ